MMLDCITGFILIVDDNPTNLSVLKQALKSAGFKVRLAVDGYSAIEQALAEQPALILLDVQMPGIDGFETCTRLKSESLTQAIPVIFTTALTDTESKVKGLSLGAVDYITKPFEEEEVLARVKAHLQLGILTKTLEEKNAQLQQLTYGLELRVQERTAALQQAQVQLVQQEKLSSLGQLVAGVAHEVNNPINCIANNILPGHEYVANLTQALKLYQHYCPYVPELEQALEDLDIEFALKDLPKLLDAIKLSTERIREISASLRNFSRSDTTSKVPFNLHSGLNSTLLILQHRLKALGQRPAIEVIKDYGNLPEIECYPGQMNQVFMNLLANAIDAIEESFELPGAASTRFPATSMIRISTESDGKMAMIRIADNGKGMTEEVRQRLFEPMFTTKPMNKGTGLGLSIAHQIVVDRHGGSLSCVSAIGEGTEFMIELPLL